MSSCKRIFTYRVAEINDGHLAILALDGTGLLGDERPDPVHVDHRAVELVLGLVEVPHTDLTEVTRVAAHMIQTSRSRSNEPV